MIKLDDCYDLAVEISGKTARLAIYENSVEKVCRKTTLKSLFEFMQSDENHLFKGRLQLFKNLEEITVLVKGEPVGEIKAETLLNCLRTDHL
ncbi:MAG TPA: hypothetical protein VNX40_00155 [Mucilaginibacter sp.]|jgi:hypothetical protein|nr:hypothetical protein [Mucilaginibacter sp.]